MSIKFDQYANTLSVTDSVNTNASLNLIPQGTGAVNIAGTGQNYLTYSQDLSNVIWNKNNATVTANSTTAPDGTNTGNTVTSTSTSSFLVQAAFSPVNAAYFTVSRYVKAGNISFCTIGLHGLADAYFNLTALTSSFSGTGAVSASITDVGNGWRRVSATWTWNGGGTYNCYFALASSLSSQAVSIGDYIYSWGHQAELSSSVGVYIVTTASKVYGTPTLSFSGVAGIGLQSDGSLYVQPAGSAALQAQATTSSTAGGNARGANAVDWQTSRTAASQVASGSGAFIGGGVQNTSSNNYTVVSGGTGNVASGGASVVIGGQNNTAGSTYAVAGGGGNSATGNYSIALGGYGVTSAGFFSTILGGQQNSATSGSAVTTQSGTMNGTTAVTLSGSNAAIKVGQYVTGTSIAGLTYVAAISGTSLTLSQNASGSSTSTLSFYTPHGVVVGGGNNTATGSYSFIGGGGDAGTAGNRNVASGDWSFVGGGQANTASGNYSYITGGFSSTASAAYSSVTGGAQHTVSGSYATACGGQSNTVSSSQAVAVGGFSNLANGLASTVVGGYYGTTRGIRGNTILPAQFNAMGTSAVGTNQTALLVLAKQTTDATASVLTSDNSAAGTSNQVILPNNSAYYFRGEVISGKTAGGDTKGWYIEGVIKRGANAASTALVGSPTVTSNYADAGASTWTIAVSADTTNGGLAITFTGQAGTTIRTVAQIRTTEMTY